jgi:hypothetical protein
VRYVQAVAHIGTALGPGASEYRAPEVTGASFFSQAQRVDALIHGVSTRCSAEVDALYAHVRARTTNVQDALEALCEIERHAKALCDARLALALDDAEEKASAVASAVASAAAEEKASADEAIGKTRATRMTTWGALAWSVWVSLLSRCLEMPRKEEKEDMRAWVCARDALRAWRAAHPHSWTHPFVEQRAW